MKKTILASAIAVGLGSLMIGTTASANATLDYDDGAYACVQGAGTAPNNCSYGVKVNDNAGSYFGMDTNGDAVFAKTERVALTDSGNGLTLDAAQAIGDFDATWSFGGNPGNHWSSGDGINILTLSGNTATADMTGWTVYWGAPASTDASGNPVASTQGDIDMGQGADAVITCDSTCAVGESFALDYTAVVPSGGFKNFNYQLHLEGVIAGEDLAVSAVPVPAAVWLFGSGLVGLAGVARRRKTA